MRTFFLLVLTLVTVTGSRPKTEKILLKEIVQSVNGILNAKEVVGIEKEWDDEVIHTHTWFNQTFFYRIFTSFYLTYMRLDPAL